MDKRLGYVTCGFERGSVRLTVFNSSSDIIGHVHLSPLELAKCVALLKSETTRIHGEEAVQGLPW